MLCWKLIIKWKVHSKFQRCMNHLIWTWLCWYWTREPKIQNVMIWTLRAALGAASAPASKCPASRLRTWDSNHSPRWEVLQASSAPGTYVSSSCWCSASSEKSPSVLSEIHPVNCVPCGHLYHNALRYMSLQLTVNFLSKNKDQCKVWWSSFCCYVLREEKQPV